MLPQFSAIPLQSTEAASDSSRNLNQLLPVGKNVSATVVAISRDQVQPEIFRLKLEINNRLIQMGVFQALPVGQKINVNRQSDGQIQISPQSNQGATSQVGDKATTTPPSTQNTQAASNTQRNIQEANIRLQTPLAATTNKLPDTGTLLAAVISSRPVYPSPAPINQQTAPAQLQTPSQMPSQTSVAATNTTSNITTNQAIQTPTQNTGTPAPATSQAPNSPTAQSAVVSTAPQNISATPKGENKPSTSNQTTTQSVSQSTGQSSNQPAGQITSQAQASANQPSNPQVASTTNTNATTNNAPQNTPAPSQTPSSQQASPAVNTQSTPVNSTRTEATPPANNTAPIRDVNAPQQTSQQTTATITNTTRASQPPIHHSITMALPDGSKIEFNSPKPLPQGAQVLLQKTGTQDAVIVKVQLPSLSPNSALDKPAIQEILRNALPIQIPTGDVFSQLAQTAAVTEGSQAAQISSVVRSMLQLFGVRPGSPEAPSQIRQNIELGGLHTERLLSEGKSPNPQDMKSQLQQLQNLADRLPDEQRERFEQLLRGLHSRVTSQQLNSLQQWRELPDGGFERVLQFDLPVKQGDRWENLELRLSREGGSNAAGEMVSVWRVRLHFDLDELGGVDAEIRLSDEHEISTYFWCDQEGTAEKLRSRADHFAERLRDCGFSNSEVQWHQGTAPEQKQPIHKKLVDLHT